MAALKTVRLFSGIQPSGDIHLGNYVGAIKNWVSLIDRYECIYCVVDYHAMTVEYDPREMPGRVLKALAVNMACGIDPKNCMIFVQSQVPLHTELAWIFNTVTPMGMLTGMTQFREKSGQHEKNVNAGLFDYPVLQAADILLYKAEVVPVGEDQVQHIEFSREVARRFNSRYGEIFPEPKELLTRGSRIMGLDDPSKKMSKSLNNHIALLDDDDTIMAKLRKAVTDPARVRRHDTGHPEVCNIFSLHQVFSKADEIAQVDTACRTAEIGCVDCKKVLHKNICAEISPIRERYAPIWARPDDVYSAVNTCAAKCRGMALETMAEVRDVTGIALPGR